MKKKYKFFKKRLERLPSLVAVLMCLLLAYHSTQAQTPSIGSFGNIVYIERAPAVLVAPDITVTNGQSYADSWIEFEISSPTTSETLGYTTAPSPVTTDGEVSIFGTDIYLGNGTDANLIGTVDATHNGQNGNKLRFNFSSALANSQFTEGSGTDIPGWTATNSQIYPGNSAGHVALFPKTQGRAVTKTGASAPYTITRYVSQTTPGQTGGTIEYQFQTNYNYDHGSREAWGYEGQSQRGLISSSSGGTPGVGADFTTTIVNDDDATGGKCLRLYSWGWVTQPNPSNPMLYASAFGPDVLSEPFDAQAGDQLALDWRASGAHDDYEVYAYLVNTSNNAHTLLFYGRGQSQPWTTATGTIPSTGNFRFRFINGSYDRTGGYLIGAEFFIDNIRVLSSVTATDAEVQQLARLTTYHNSSCTPSPTRTLTFRARSATGQIGSAQATINITLVNCPPTLTANVTNPTFVQGSSAVNLFNNASASTIEPGQSLTELRFIVSGVSDGSDEIINLDGSAIPMIAGSGTTTSNNFSYNVTSSSPLTVSLTRAGDISESLLQTVIDGMTYQNNAAPLTIGQRTVTLTFLSDDGGTANGGEDETILNIPSTITVYGIPEVITANPVVLSATSATLGGEVITGNGTIITGRGYVYSTSLNPTTTSFPGGANVTHGFGVGTFSNDVSGLSTGVVYYVRAYAINDYGTYYGNEISFTTQPNDPTGISADITTIICPGVSVELTASGVEGTVYWYTESCGETEVGTGNPITVSPLETTEFFARNFNGTFSAGCASITVLVEQPLTLDCPGDISVNTDSGSCGATVSFSATPGGTPTPDVTYTLDGTTIDSPHFFGVGTHIVVATATNDCGSVSCTFNVTVNDNEAPVVETQNIIIDLDEITGTAVITPQDIDNGSSDPCGIASMTLDRTEFGCEDMGETITVNLTVTDVNGNSNTGSATVTVNELSVPATRVTVRAENAPDGQVRFIATPVNGGDNPTFVWYKNGSPVSGVSGNEYITTVKSGDIHWVVMTSSIRCTEEATSNEMCTY